MKKVGCYSFTFPIRAISKDNEKIFGRHGRPFLSAKYKNFERVIAHYFLSQKPANFRIFSKPVEVEWIFYFKNRKHPDLANLEKSVTDALNKLLWTDDRLILAVRKEVRYSNHEKIELSVWSKKNEKVD